MRKNYFVLLNSLILLIIINSLVSCDFYTKDVKTVNVESLSKSLNEIKSPGTRTREWSILIYMAADNDLEAAALEDLYEMEVSHLNTKNISVFILLDRSNSYDSSYGDWSGTRLYKLETGRDRECKTIISEEISCEDLGLYKDRETELDMASGYNLSKAFNFIKKHYPAEQMGFIMWGHGTGWRSENNFEKKYKGFAHDDSTDSYMTLKQFGDALRTALNGKKLDFLGLDTCFGGEIEVMYELKDCTNFAIGTEGLLLFSGWDYERIFNEFNKMEEKTSQNLINISIKSFKEDYELSSNASIVGVNMEHMQEYFNNFDSIMKTVADEITTKQIRDKVFNSFYKDTGCQTQNFSYGEKNSDVYLDICSLITTCSDLFPNNEELQNKLERFCSCTENFIFNSWSSFSKKGSLGVYFGTLTAGNLISSVHDISYKKGRVMEQILFVKDSTGYVPGQIENYSLLDKLFYVDY